MESMIARVATTLILIGVAITAGCSTTPPSVSGRIVGTDGRPVPGVTLTLTGTTARGEGGQGGGVGSRTVVSKSDGSFDDVGGFEMDAALDVTITVPARNGMPEVKHVGKISNNQDGARTFILETPPSVKVQNPVPPARTGYAG